MWRPVFPEPQPPATNQEACWTTAIPQGSLGSVGSPCLNINAFALWVMTITERGKKKISNGIKILHVYPMVKGRKRKTGQHVLLFVFQDNFTLSLREFNSVPQEKHPEVILLAL